MFPFGIYDIAKNRGHVCVGVSNNTPEFAVCSIARWWRGLPQRVREFAGGQQEGDEAATGVGRIVKVQVTSSTGAALQPHQRERMNEECRMKNFSLLPSCSVVPPAPALAACRPSWASGKSRISSNSARRIAGGPTGESPAPPDRAAPRRTRRIGHLLPSLRPHSPPS
ncbi:MAG: hypothetical protein FJ387_00115 [Verrucomicrobia bacterium]|nr:hypothetical protein [Verrucomicrobiota bacterium]